jgi:NAD(P)H-hydrate repair Nnr-like enzyme with NAD(P)H-hydrate dehydratase domain
LSESCIGDVLTGIITSLVAQILKKPIDAAIIADYLHGLCEDLKNNDTSIQSFIASNIIDNLEKPFLSLGI